MNVENIIIPTAINERKIEHKLNGIIVDECLIDFEVETYFNEKTYTVRTWYNTNEPYAFRKKEKNKEFKTVREAKKEMSIRAKNWKAKFETL